MSATLRWSPEGERIAGEMAWNRPRFIPGLELSRRFFDEAVQPIINDRFSDLAYSAGLLGWGSEVQGFDDARSRDHNWGPRLLLFLREEDLPNYKAKLTHCLATRLPRQFLGYSTHFSPPNAADGGTQFLIEPEDAPIRHLVLITTIPGFMRENLGTRWCGPSPADWLLFPSQRLRAVTRGAVWHDALGLQEVRDRFAWYPRDVWLYLLASLWEAIGQEEPFVGRTAEHGDELGSRLLAARQIQLIMRLAFLLEKQYAPYSKWFGTAFAQLRLAQALTPHLFQALQADSYTQREEGLIQAGLLLLNAQNNLGLVAPLPVEAGWFFTRPFRVMHGDVIASALREAIADPGLCGMPLIGSPDQFSPSTDLIDSIDLLSRLRILYGID